MGFFSKKLSRRLVCLGLVTIMVLSLTACGSKKNSADDGSIREDLTAVELTVLMGNGINLGNTMEACSTSGTANLSPSVYETLWNMPTTTQEMVQAMKDAGFDTLRIPVAWITNATDYKNGDYTINEAYLERVKEIVDYARNADMYVIINDHWDGGWWSMFGSADETQQTMAMDIFVSMWTQIAEYFKDYSDYVIFEVGNEELGTRFNDDSVIDGEAGILTTDECYELANELNQKFVDIVRSTGGNNASRFLLIAGFGTDITNTCDDRFEMPTDTADSKLLISVHFYDPSSYCIFRSVETWGTEKEYNDMNDTLAKMVQFTEAGYGVVIGECGVLFEGSTELADRAIEYYINLISICDIYGYCPVLWSCNDTFDRDNLCICDETLAQMFLDYSYASQSTMTQEEIIAQAEAAMAEGLANALSDGTVSDDTCVAWIMYNDADWEIFYCSGDTYDSTSRSTDLIATDAIITGEGTYTISIDLTQTWKDHGNSVVFSAIGLANAENLFPGYYVENIVVKVNGEVVTLTGDTYTTSDDGVCTRVNLYNSWVTKLPDSARRSDGDLSNATPTPLDSETLGTIYTLEVTFDFIAP